MLMLDRGSLILCFVDFKTVFKDYRSEVTS